MTHAAGRAGRPEVSAGVQPYEWAVWAVLATVSAVTVALVARPAGAVVSLAVHAACALPGVLLVSRACRGRGRWLPTVAFGPLAGVAASSAAVLALWAAGCRGPWVVIAGPAAVCLLAFVAPRFHGRWQGIAPHRADLVCLGLLLLLVPLLVARPFSQVGLVLPDGEAYRAYFTADFVWRRAVVAELAKGTFLPLNPFFLHDELHYYWLPHLIDAVEYRWLADAADLNGLLLADSVFVDLAFVAFLYGVARTLVRRPAAAAAGVACSVLATSFEGIYGIWVHVSSGAPISLLRQFNVDAISRWLLQAMPIDGLQRLLWYQPHHALGYALGFLGLLAVARRARAVDPLVFAVAGTLLALSTLISSFGGLMLTCAAAVHEGVPVLRRLDWRRGAAHLLAASVPLAIAVIVIFDLRYVDPGGQVIQFGVNSMATHNVIPATALSFGPMILLAGPGLWMAWQRRRWEATALTALLGVCVAFYFLVDIRDHQNVYVGWRVGHLTFIACGALAGLTFERIGAMRRHAALAWTGVAVVIAAALPTVAIDAYNTQDVGNRQRAAGFRWTLVLAPDELDALAWIRTETPPNAVFQVDPVVRDPDTWAYLAAFGERRMSAGLPISMVPLDKYVYESSRIRRVFDEEVFAAHERARRAGVQYLLVGPPERAAHPGVEQRFDAAPYLFSPAYRNGTIAIYRVAGAGP